MSERVHIIQEDTYMNPDDKYEYLKDRIGNTIHICSTLAGRIADTVILYGIRIEK